MHDLCSLLQTQSKAEAQFSEFIESLDPERTVTLRELITHPELAHKLRAPWLNLGLFVRRLEAMCAFYASLTPHLRLTGRTKRRLVFFQSSPEHEDRQESNGNQALTEGAKRRGMEPNTPVQAFYLHTNPLWFETQGDWGSRRIRPLAGFTNWTWRPLFKECPSRDHFANAIGWRITNWPKWLGVSNDVATDYVARIVIHDIGHEILPGIHPDIDSLHNAVMITAMGAQPLSRYASTWEEVVHRECIDPYFMVDGGALLRQCDLAALTPLQRYLHMRFRRWYDCAAHTASNEKLWGISPLLPVERKRAHIDSVIDEMRSNGFLRYIMKSIEYEQPRR